MISVSKTTSPEDYSQWCNTQLALGVNYNYPSLPSDIKECLLGLLVLEQGQLCGYTMKRIDINSSHVEHVIPQNICRERELGLDLDYFNFLACYPQNGILCRFGAVEKGGWWGDTDEDFISGLTEGCELKFLFQSNGEVSGVRGEQSPSATTIRVLNLNNATLVEDRRNAIDQFLYGEDGMTPLEFDAANNAIESILERNSSGQLPEFCLAIHDCLYEYLDIINTLASE